MQPSDPYADAARMVRTAVLEVYEASIPSAGEDILAQAWLEDCRLFTFDVLLGAMAAERAMALPIPMASDQAMEVLASINGAVSIVEDLVDQVRASLRDEQIPVDVVSVAFEMTYGLSVDAANESQVTSSSKQRDNGVFFTPQALADAVSNQAFISLGEVGDRRPAEWSILDPSSGAGAFVVGSLRAYARLVGSDSDHSAGGVSLVRRFASTCLFAVDKDRIAVEIARRLVWLEVGDNEWDGRELEDHFRCADSLTAKLSEWREWFPRVFTDGGFDLVIGNPPWGPVKARRKEFLEHIDDRARETYGSDLRRQLVESDPTGVTSVAALWNEYVSETVSYAATLRTSEEFTHQGGAGDRDLYKYFMERSFDLAHSDHGVVSLIVPAGFLRTKGAGKLRSFYLAGGTFEYVNEFINKRRIFPIHSMFRFVIFAYRRGKALGMRRVKFGGTTIEDLASDHRSQESSDLSIPGVRRLGGPHLVIPEIRSTGEQKLLEKLLAAHPPLGDRGQEAWNVRFRREVDMTNDSDEFVHIDLARHSGWIEIESGVWRDADGAEYLPVVEGRMVQQFDSAAKAYVRGVGRRARWESVPLGENRVAPQFLFPANLATAKGISTRPRAGFRDVTGHANERTVLSAMIPGDSVAGNKVPTCVFDSDDERLPYVWTALANSFVIDWIARRYVSTTLNFFYLELLPFPRIPVATVEAHELASIAKSLAVTGTRTPQIPGVVERARARAKIDALVALQFGLTTDEFSLILDDFPLLDRQYPMSRGVTRDLAMLEFHQRMGETSGDAVVDLRCQVESAAGAGAFAYC